MIQGLLRSLSVARNDTLLCHCEEQWRRSNPIIEYLHSNEKCLAQAFQLYRGHFFYLVIFNSDSSYLRLILSERARCGGLKDKGSIFLPPLLPLPRCLADQLVAVIPAVYSHLIPLLFLVVIGFETELYILMCVP